MSASKTARLPGGYRAPLLDAVQSLAAEVTCPPPPPTKPAPKEKHEKPKKHKQKKDKR